MKYTLKEKLTLLKELENLDEYYDVEFKTKALKKSIQKDLDAMAIVDEKECEEYLTKTEDMSNVIKYEIPVEDINLSITNGLFFNGEEYLEIPGDTGSITLEASVEEFWKILLVMKIYNA